MNVYDFAEPPRARRAEEKCCYDTAEVPPEVGCYNDDYPFDNMPLPNCPAEIEVSMRVFTRDNPNEGQIITRTTIPLVVFSSRARTVVCMKPVA